MTLILKHRIKFFPVLMFFAASALYGQSQDGACAMCHGNSALAMTRHGRSVSLFVDGAELKSSAHGVLSCSSCHGNFNAMAVPHADPVQPVKCESCHNIGGFADNAHIKSGAATCKSCHGSHDIKPASDPKSTVHPDKLTATCGQCHSGANENFARVRIHADKIGEQREGPVYWIRSIYIVLIVVTIGLMFLHNLLDFIRRTRRSFDMRRGRLIPSHHGRKQYVRMTLLDRIQHAGLLVCFLLLVITGFMMRFPDAWWAGFIKTYCEPFFEARGIVHRAAAVVITAVSLFHVGVLVFTRHGRKLAADIFPGWSDVKDVFLNLRYLLGLSSKKPRFDRFSYMEKAEYWALVWGMVIMFASGIILCFTTFFMNLFGGIGRDVARTVHYYEAILAALAIIVWHFYFVLFSPNIYPMNTAWLNGKISEDEMAEEHPLELERILRQEQEAQALEAQTKDSPEK